MATQGSSAGFHSVLSRQGQTDVLARAADNPTHGARLGTYLTERARLDSILNLIGVAPELRENYLRRLKLDTRPTDRFDVLAGDLAAAGHLTADDARSFARHTMPDGLANRDGFVPNLIPNVDPTSEPPVEFRLQGDPIHVGDGVAYNRRVMRDGEAGRSGDRKWSVASAPNSHDAQPQGGDRLARRSIRRRALGRSRRC